MLDNPREKEVLPVGPEDEVIPTRIHEIDMRCDFIHDQMDALQRELAEADVERVRLINRAKEVHIMEDFEYKIIEEPIYPKKHVDVEAFKRLAPAEHAQVVANLTKKATEKLQEQIQKIAVSISQADVKAVIASKGLLAQIIPEPKEPSGYRTVIVKK